MSYSNIEAFAEKLPKGIDAAVITEPVMRRWLTGFASSAGMVLVIPGHSYFLTDFRYFEAATAAVKDAEVILADRYRHQIKELLTKAGAKTLGLVDSVVTVAESRVWQKDMEGIECVFSEELGKTLQELAMIKNETELSKIREAQKITDAAFQHFLNTAMVGMTEQEIALDLEIFMRKQGAEGLAFDSIVVSGAKSSLPHGTPGNKKIQRGDFLTLDMGARYEGYCSDMTRTVAFGTISEKQNKVYQTVLEAQLAALREIKAGKVCKDIDKVARDIINGAGYDGCFGHGLGHSLGLQIHESPRFSPTCDTVLKPNMVMTVEPGIYLQGEFGVRIEDMVIVTENGCENLTQSPKELIIL